MPLNLKVKPIWFSLSTKFIGDSLIEDEEQELDLNEEDLDEGESIKMKSEEEYNKIINEIESENSKK